MNQIAEYIKQRLSLRKPLQEALDILTHLAGELELKKEVDLKTELDKVKELYPTCTDFEREFVSICYSIATGVGKTRLMGACIAWLYLEKGIKNFFVLAPNLTIYNKLIEDFGNSSNPKYVFNGIADFVHNKPVIITGDNYNQVSSLFSEIEIRINIFNVSKFARETKPVKQGGKNLAPRIKRLSEYLGQSYWEYLSNLNDLVILMDEAHRYHADKSKEAINELKPILGLELTATPIDEKGNQFRNVVYEYSLAQALDDGLYVKNPTIATRKDFNPQGRSEEEIEKIKLEDAVSIHEDTKQELKLFALNTGKRLVKPFILVVCKDTTHARAVYDLVTSPDFYEGVFTEKVLQIDSTTRNEELIEQQFVSLENEDSEIEIVIHVNMLKEGWDVANLYTIVPLRAANALTLIEQTIGRGLRLPFGGKRTGVEKVDMLSIMMHDKFQEVIDAANDRNSILYSIGKIELNKSDLNLKKVLVESRTNDVVELEAEAKQIPQIKDNDIRTKADKQHKAKVIINTTIRNIISQKTIQTPAELSTQAVKERVISEIKEIIIADYPEMPEKDQIELVKAAKAVYQTAVDDIVRNNILIPNIRISILENKGLIKDFDLDTDSFTENILQQEFELLRETIYDHKQDRINIRSSQTTVQPEFSILELLKKKSEIDYDNNSDILFKLCEQAVRAIKTSLKKPETLGDTVLMYCELIANKIYIQVKENLVIEIVAVSKPEPEPYSLILPWNYSKEKDDDILYFRETVSARLIRTKVFNGFSKSCHDKYKFDSIPEKRFAEILEDSKDVIKWLRPATKQFNLWYNHNSNRYIPDFVAETSTVIYLIEIKAEDETEDKVVVMKEKAAVNYCNNATEINKSRHEKAWKYVLIPHDKTDINMTFRRLVTEFEK